MTSQKGLGLSTTTFWGVMMWQHLYKSHLPQKGNVNSATTLETLAINFIQIFFKQMNQISLSFPLPKGKQWKTCCPFSCEFFQEIIVWYWSCWMASRWSTGVVIPYKCQCPTHRSWSRIKDGILDGQQRMVHLKKWLVSFPSSVHLQVFSAFKGLMFRRSMWRFRGLWTICLAFFLPFCSAKHRFSLCQRLGRMEPFRTASWDSGIWWAFIARQTKVLVFFVEGHKLYHSINWTATCWFQLSTVTYVYPENCHLVYIYIYLLIGLDHD